MATPKTEWEMEEGLRERYRKISRGKAVEDGELAELVKLTLVGLAGETKDEKVFLSVVDRLMDLGAWKKRGEKKQLKEGDEGGEMDKAEIENLRRKLTTANGV